MTSPHPSQAEVVHPDVVHPEDIAPPPTALVEDSAAEPTKVHSSPKRNENGAAKSTLASVVIALFVITFVVQAFQIPSGSMEKTLLIGDYVMVDKVHLAGGGWGSELMPYREIRRVTAIMDAIFETCRQEGSGVVAPF